MIDLSSPYVILIAVLVVAALASSIALIARGRRSSGAAGPRPPAAPQRGAARGEVSPSEVSQGEIGPGEDAGQAAGGGIEDEFAVTEGDVPASADVPDEAPVAAAPALDQPEPVLGRFGRLKARLARSGSPLGAKLLAVLSRDSLSEDDWDELEETLLLADIGAGPAVELVDDLRSEVRVRGLADPGEVRALLRKKLVELVDPHLDRSLNLDRPETADGTQKPAVVLVVGVNGAGKTTTVGKLTRVLVAEGKQVVLGAADTFRAAAADQLTTWGNRVGVETVRSDRDGADPASVAFDAVKRGSAQGVDVVLVDTAGRLQNKTGLMDELGKVSRVIEKEAPLSEVLLVLDATTGQNGLTQARVFTEVAGVTGIVLTKLDGTAKGGIVVAVQRELGLPVKLVGLGEGPDDLAPFDPEQFVDGLLGEA